MQQLSSWQRFVPVVLLLAATAFALNARGGKEVLPPHEGLSAFPMQIVEWHGRELELTPATLEVLGPGQFLSRDYQRSPLEAPVNLEEYARSASPTVIGQHSHVPDLVEIGRHDE